MKDILGHEAQEAWNTMIMMLVAKKEMESENDKDGDLSMKLGGLLSFHIIHDINSVILT